MSLPSTPPHEPNEPNPILPARFARVRAIVGLLILALGIYFIAGPMQSADMDSVRADVAAMGLGGVLVYFIAFALLQPFGISSHFFCFSAAMIWGFPSALFLTWLGSIFATAWAFTFARYVARDFIQARIPPRFAHINERLANSDFRTLIILRAIFWCAPPIGFGLGISRFPAWKHHLASAIGVIPQTALSSLLAAGLREAIDTGDYTSGVFIGAVITFALFGGLLLYYGISLVNKMKMMKQPGASTAEPTESRLLEAPPEASETHDQDHREFDVT